MNILQESILDYLYKEKLKGKTNVDENLKDVTQSMLQGKRLPTLTELKQLQNNSCFDKYIQAVMERLTLSVETVLVISQVTEEEYQNFIIGELGVNKWKPIRSKIETCVYTTYINNLNQIVSLPDIANDTVIDYSNILSKSLPIFNKNQIDFILSYIGYERLTGFSLLDTLKVYVKSDLKDLVEEFKVKNNELLETKTVTTNDLKHIKVISPQVKEEHVDKLAKFFLKKAIVYLNM